MKRFMFCAVMAISLGSVAHARSDWTDPLAAITVNCGFFDSNYIRTPCTANGSLDDRDSWRQHLGTDFRAGVGDTIRSPVSGKIGPINNSGSGETAYITVIDSRNTNEIHILGHVKPLAGISEGVVVTKGQAVATVLYQKSGTHFHWGFNVAGWRPSPKYYSTCLRGGVSGLCEWGWGKAPFEVTRDQAVARGWRPVL